MYASIIIKVNGLNEKLHIIKDSLSGSQVSDSKLKFFNKAVSFLYICGQRNDLGYELHGLHGCDMANQHNPKALTLAEIGYSFVDVIDNQIHGTTFSWKRSQKNIEGNKQTFFAITTEIKSVTFTRMIQLQLWPSYQCLNKKYNFKIFFILLMKLSKN